MGECIEREALQAALVRKRCGVANQRYTEGWNDCLLRVKSMVSKFPAADVAPVRHGRKIENGNIGCFGLCSLCSECLPYGANYCPHCGARMDGDSDAE